MQQQILQLLRELRLPGMASMLNRSWDKPNNLSHDEWLYMLLTHEISSRTNSRILSLTKQAKLPQHASIEELHYNRGFDKMQILNLSSCGFIRNNHNILVTGATGCGKSYLASALGHVACCHGYKVRYIKLNQYLDQLSMAHDTGSFNEELLLLKKIDLLILDDFGLFPLTPRNRHDLFTIIEERHNLKSTLVTSQLPIESWYDYIGDPTIADAILDRLLEKSHKLELTGKSMRKPKNNNELEKECTT